MNIAFEKGELQRAVDALTDAAHAFERVASDLTEARERVRVLEIELADVKKQREDLQQELDELTQEAP